VGDVLLSDDLQFQLSNRKSKQRVLDAIDRANREATPALVVESTGLPFSEATWWLNKVASETGAHLKVLDDGGIIYKFAPGYRNTYVATGLAAALLAIWSVCFDTGFWLLRMSFGVMLIASVLVVVLLIILVVILVITAAMTATVAAVAGSDGGGGDCTPDVGGIVSAASEGIWHLGLFDVGDLFIDTWRWDYAHNHQRQVASHQDKGHFFLACFSFLFGEGDPNVDHEEDMWRAVSSLLQDRGGVVTAEELSPLTGSAPGDDAGVFPVLTRFGGHPEVTEHGAIVYLFPAFHRHLGSQQDSDRWRRRKRPLACVQEQLWTFSKYGLGELLMVVILASLNLAGSWWLYKHIATINFLHHIALFIDFLFGFASMFFIIPIGRAIHQVIVNATIISRNAQREEALEAYFHHSPDLGLALEDCERIRLELAGQREAPAQIVYTTEKDALEQEFESGP